MTNGTDQDSVLGNQRLSSGYAARNQRCENTTTLDTSSLYRIGWYIDTHLIREPPGQFTRMFRFTKPYLYTFVP